MKKFLFLLCMSCLISPCFADQAPQQINQNGRYVFIQHPQFRADQYILDTKTGKVWLEVQDVNSKELYFKAVRFKNFDGQIKYILQ